MEIQYTLKPQDILTLNTCMVCSSSDLSNLSSAQISDDEGNQFTFLETCICNNCSHIFRNKIPREDWFLSQFNIRDKIQKKSGFNPINNDVEMERYKRYQQISKSLKLNFLDNKLYEISEVLDVGCGPGTGLNAWKDLGIYAKGIEPDESRARHGINQGLDIETVTWMDFNENLEKGTLLTSIQSLEHFYNPKNFLKHMRSLCKEEVMIYVEVPDALSFCEDWNDAIYLAHTSNFSLLSLTKLLNICGFNSVSRIHPYDSDEFNKENLCVIAYSGEGNSDLLEHLEEDSDISSYKSIFTKRYSVQDPTGKNSINKYFVEQINDLSLTFKRTNKIESSVRGNYESREVKVVQDTAQVY